MDVKQLIEGLQRDGMMTVEKARWLKIKALNNPSVVERELKAIYGDILKKIRCQIDDSRRSL